ncbi:MAG: FHA domain-containing protein [Bacteroidota bacterium]
MMIVCDKCGHKNMEGSLYCSECGTRLLLPTSDLDLHGNQVELGEMAPVNKPSEITRRPGTSRLDTWGTLHLLDTGQMLPLSDRNEFTLGRTSEGQPIMPDIDLSPYHAYASGVSRLHAVIKRSSAGITVMDLGSSNGTYLNGKRLTPNTENVLHHGDVVAFGKLKMQVLLKT